MKNTVSNLPLGTKDIKSRVNRNYAIGAAVTILWCAAVLAAINIFNLSSDHIRIVSAAALVATIAIPVRLLRPHRVILDRDWTGVVTKAVRTNRPQSALSGFLDRRADVIVPVITLHIERSGKKAATKQCRLKKDEFEYAEALAAYYSAGSAVHCYKGLKYLKKEDNTIRLNGAAHRLCVVCGNFNDPKHAKCRNCKSTLLE